MTRRLFDEHGEVWLSPWTIDKLSETESRERHARMMKAIAGRIEQLAARIRGERAALK